MTVQQSTELKALEDPRIGHTAVTICPVTVASDDERRSEWLEVDKEYVFNLEGWR